MASTYFILKKFKKKRNACKRRLAEDSEKDNNFEKDTDVASATLRCRVCLNDARIPIPIFGDEQHKDISEETSLFGGIEIRKDDAFPKHLCDACYVWLEGAILFRKSAKETENSLVQNMEVNFDPPSDNEGNDDSYNCEETVPNNENDIHVVPPKLYSCKLCKKNFKSNEEYMRHRSSRDHKNVRIQCTICNRLLTAQLYKRHLIRHQTASHLICEVCGKLYRKDNLVRHLQLHSFDLPFQCQSCPYRGRFMESLRIHMRTHTGDKPFSCDKCQLRFLTRSNLNRHLLTHKKERPFKCHECGRGFYTKCDMDVHFKSDHVGIKDFGCRMCGSKYGTRKALMRHELRVHKRDKMAKGRVPLYLQSEYRRQCDN
ncbi:hypothetical protein MSG28_014150 [Choristoneura fumiferana]|uniref:Uncharacterized protein n=1 Tax=Choristoneura fumiferana TaxID=7141 RepID=A0ACC0JFY8_CHOFU|nr:hypothetical protein MSG28_014150 [Choristoneura fumiferana]